MRTKKLATLVVAALFFLAAAGASALAQEKAPATPTPPAAKTMKVVGKIVKDESMGGYYIQGTKPPEIFRILNQNPKVLAQYAKSGKDVTIEAVSALGDNLVVEKIEGKKYEEYKKQ